MKTWDASPEDAVTRSDGRLRTHHARIRTHLSRLVKSSWVFSTLAARGAVYAEHSDRQNLSQSAMRLIRLAKKSERSGRGGYSIGKPVCQGVFAHLKGIARNVRQPKF